MEHMKDCPKKKYSVFTPLKCTCPEPLPCDCDNEQKISVMGHCTRCGLKPQLIDLGYHKKFCNKVCECATLFPEKTETPGWKKYQEDDFTYFYSRESDGNCLPISKEIADWIVKDAKQKEQQRIFDCLPGEKYCWDYFKDGLPGYNNGWHDCLDQIKKIING